MADFWKVILGSLASLVALTAHAGSNSQPTTCAPPSGLRAMKEAGDVVRAMYPFDIDPKSPLAERAADRVMLVDRQNTAQLRPWLQRCGWPSVTEYGEEVEGLVWLLVQHADQDRPFQQLAIRLLRRRVQEGSAPGIHLAYLEDRLAVGMGQPQRYGTQAEQKGPCQVKLLPVDDPAKVAERRKQAGLNTLDAYVAHLRGALLPANCRTDAQRTP